MARSSPDRLARLESEHPEWRPWLLPLARARRAASSAVWQTCLPTTALEAGDETPPLLAGAVIAVEPRLLATWLAELAGAAAEAGSASAGSLRARAGSLDALAVLEAGLDQDRRRLAALAADVGVQSGALEAVAGLLAWPLLQTCGQQWAHRIPPSWRGGYCPICGAWPTLAETRGVERVRRFRCGRCGSDWHADWLRCPYCGMAEHDRLGSLVSELAAGRRRVDVCRACGGYVKGLTTLQATPAPDVAVADLASVDLDVVALEHGFTRPEGAGYPLGLRVVETPRRGRRLFAWRA